MNLPSDRNCAPCLAAENARKAQERARLNAATQNRSGSPVAPRPDTSGNFDPGAHHKATVEEAIARSTGNFQR